MRGRSAIPGVRPSLRGVGTAAMASLLLAVAGCGSGSSTDESAGAAETTSATPSATEPTEPQRTPTDPATGAGAVDGEDAASALTDFACSPAVGVSERWAATGTLTNDESDAVTYQMTVVVVGSTGTAGVGSERLVEVPAGSTADVDLSRVRGPLDGTCQVQVLRVG